MNPLLLAILAAGGLFAVSSASSSSSGQGTAWPPSAGVQQALQTQIANMWQASGQTLQQTDLTTLSSYITTGISQYAASFPAGSTPTTDGFSAWMLTQAAIALQQTAQQSQAQGQGQGLSQGQSGTSPTYGGSASGESALSTLGTLSSMSNAPQTIEAASETAGDLLGSFLT